MSKLQHLVFLALMIPTFVVIAAAAVSLADLAHPATLEAGARAASQTTLEDWAAGQQR